MTGVSEARPFEFDHAAVVSSESEDEAATGEQVRESFGRSVQRVLMTGVSYMIPFVAAGGLLIALGFLLGGYNITQQALGAYSLIPHRHATCSPYAPSINAPARPSLSHMPSFALCSRCILRERRAPRSAL